MSLLIERDFRNRLHVRYTVTMRQLSATIKYFSVDEKKSTKKPARLSVMTRNGLFPLGLEKMGLCLYLAVPSGLQAGVFNVFFEIMANQFRMVFCFGG